MKRTLKLFLSLATALGVVCALAACGEPHKHNLVWLHSPTEHWQVCTVPGCDGSFDEARGEHVGSPCEVCGPAFRAVAFYTGINDQAHVSFVNEANQWFAEQAVACNFLYERVEQAQRRIPRRVRPRALPRHAARRGLRARGL